MIKAYELEICSGHKAKYGALEILDKYFKCGNFHEGFIFTKLRICKVSRKLNPCKKAKSLCHLLIYVNHALVLNFNFTNMSFNPIRENNIHVKISEFTVNKFMTRTNFKLIWVTWFLFDLNLYVPSTIFQLYRDRSSWVESVLS